MDFGHALDLMRTGHVVTRAGWNGKDMYVGMAQPSRDSILTKPFFYMRTVQGDFVVWLASQTDIQAQDWELGNAAQARQVTGHDQLEHQGDAGGGAS